VSGYNFFVLHIVLAKIALNISDVNIKVVRSQLRFRVLCESLKRDVMCL
jgi:predicted amino acid-binding ACT domain protein